MKQTCNRRVVITQIYTFQFAMSPFTYNLWLTFRVEFWKCAQIFIFISIISYNTKQKNNNRMQTSVIDSNNYGMLKQHKFVYIFANSTFSLSLSCLLASEWVSDSMRWNNDTNGFQRADRIIVGNETQKLYQMLDVFILTLCANAHVSYTHTFTFVFCNRIESDIFYCCCCVHFNDISIVWNDFASIAVKNVAKRNK